MRLGRLFKNIGAIAGAITATTGSLRSDGIRVPLTLEKLEERARQLEHAGTLLSGSGGALRQFDEFFDRAATLDSQVKLTMLAADGSVLEELMLSPFIVDAMDALLDRLESITNA